jgi:phosphoenolpyruvate synthase/pyruvate phosphate dikinase
VFFRPRRHRSPRNNPRVAEHSDAGNPETTLRQTQQLQHWRRSAQRVTRAWNAWRAAENRDRAIRYRVLMAALGDEEKSAADVQRMVDLANARPSVATTDPGEEEPWARELARF